MNTPNNIEDIYPLSPMQQGILFHTLLAPQTGIYIPQICLTLKGNLNSLHLKKAWEQILARHPILRTAFNWERRDKPFQIVYRQLSLPWFEQDWRSFSTHEQQQLLEKFLKQDRQENFDLKKPPLIRLNLIRLSDEKSLLIWTQHHLILDGWSSALIIKEVFTLYQNKNLSLSRPYGEYIAWLNQQDVSLAKQFWQTRLKGLTTPTSLKMSLASPPLKKEELRFREKTISLSKTTTSALKSFAKQHQLTLNTLIQSAYALLLSRYTGEEDIIFGATCSGRPPTLAGVESMVGLFINTLPVRVQVSPQTPLIPWLKNLQTQHLETLQYEYSSLLDIQEWSDIPAGTPLFESILVFENYPVDSSFSQQEQELSICEISSVEWTSFPLTVLIGSGAELSIKIKYDSEQFSSATITRMLRHFQTLLENIILNPQQCLGTITILTVTEQEQLLVKFNNTQTDYPNYQCLYQRFEEQAEKTPDAIAVIFEDQKLTYQKLNIKANKLAHYLQNLGIKPGVLVGICVERSLEMVIGILGILKAGGAYLPIDPTYPQERQSFMLADAQVSLLLTQQHLEENFSSPNLKKICLDKEEKIALYPEFNPPILVNPEQEIYVIYTSGSTGTPKGVVNTHKGLLNRLIWMQETYQLTASDRVLQKTSLSFDVSVWEIFWPLLEGACLVLAKPGGHQDTSYLINLIQQQKITTLHFVPSMLQVFLEDPRVKNCQSIKRVICSGEALSVEVQNRFFESLKADLHNLYGPTEAAIDVTYWHCQPDQNSSLSVSIGRPIANTQIYLLDAHQQIVPIGVPGELHIGGDGLARGYYNRPELTAEKFIPNPFSKGNRLYKTGDLARYLPDGTIEFLGRIDYQVKIRGFRIELGEIESVLTQHPQVKGAVVMVQEEAENKSLVAYIVPQQNDSLLLSLLPSFLEEKLPLWMIPSHFVILEQFPLSFNGKLDRKALLRLNKLRNISNINFVAPRNSTEEKIATIWSEVLKIEKIGIYDNFFELGGNSLLAIRVNTRLYQTFKLDLPLRTLFEKPTIFSLAQRIEIMYMITDRL